MINSMAKTAKEPYKDNAYEVWSANDWTWYVLKKYQADDSKRGARWFCLVVTPYIPEGELGDVYAKDVMENAVRER